MIIGNVNKLSKVRAYISRQRKRLTFLWLIAHQVADETLPMFSDVVEQKTILALFCPEQGTTRLVPLPSVSEKIQ